MPNDQIRKKPSKQDAKNLKDLVAKGVVTPNRPGNPRKGYSVRAIPDNSYESETYPGFADHPTNQGIQYAKDVNLNGMASVWDAINNDNYASGGMPKWIIDNTSAADISIYWHMVHRQRVWSGIANMSVQTMSRCLGMQYRSVQRCIRNLLRIGLIIKVAENAGRKTNVYKVQLPSSIKPKILESKRRVSGFIEVTAESVEVTAENSRGNHADTQKTKPLKGLVSEDRAKARLATTNKKIDTNSYSKPNLKTIDEETKARKKKINLDKARERKSLVNKIRAYHDHEVEIAILEHHLETCPPLRNLFDACIDIAKVSGGVNEATGEVFGYWKDHGQESAFLNLQQRLTSTSFNVNNLDEAIEFTLQNLHKQLQNMAKDVQDKKDAWNRNARDLKERKEREEKEEKARAQALADAEALAIADAIAAAVANERKLQELIKQKKTATALLDQISHSLHTLLPNWQKNFDVYSPREALSASNYHSKYWPLLEGLQDSITLLFGDVKWSDASEKIKQDSIDAWVESYKVHIYNN